MAATKSPTVAAKYEVPTAAENRAAERKPLNPVVTEQPQKGNWQEKGRDSKGLDSMKRGSTRRDSIDSDDRCCACCCCCCGLDAEDACCDFGDTCSEGVGEVCGCVAGMFGDPC